MTLPHGIDLLESARLVLRRIAPDDLQHLYPGGRPPDETAAWLQATLESYEQLRGASNPERRAPHPEARASAPPMVHWPPGCLGAGLSRQAVVWAATWVHGVGPGARADRDAVARPLKFHRTSRDQSESADVREPVDGQ
jgi:hypothetical protein